MKRKVGRILKIRDFIVLELKARRIKPYTFAQEFLPKTDGGTLHRFLKGHPREKVTFNFVADLLQKLNLPFATLDSLNLNEEPNEQKSI